MSRSGAAKKNPDTVTPVRHAFLNTYLPNWAEMHNLTPQVRAAQDALAVNRGRGNVLQAAMEAAGRPGAKGPALNH